MRIGCLQFAPTKGDVDNNLARADAVLLKADPKELDILVLPEMAFTGYDFSSLAEIYPHLEPSGSGISSLWARTTALRYGCNVIVPYPEKVESSLKGPAVPEYYNSAIIINEEGETVGHYRKTHLYLIDETWAIEGNQGFYHGEIDGAGSTALGLSMDLNPYRFETPWHAFEMAFHVLEVQANLVIVSMAWPTNEDGSTFSQAPQEPDMDSLMYWVSRLEPVIRAENQEEVIVVFANRTGFEGEAVYAGTSAVLGILEGEVRVYGLLGRSDKEVLIVDTDCAPYGKLLYRPEGAQPTKEPRQRFYSNESPSIGSSAANWVPLPASPSRTTVTSISSGSLRADSETLGFDEPPKAKPKPIKEAVETAAKSEQPKTEKADKGETANAAARGPTKAERTESATFEATESSEPVSAKSPKPDAKGPARPEVTKLEPIKFEPSKAGPSTPAKRIGTPKLSLQTGADVLHGCACNQSAWSTSSIVDSLSESNPSVSRVLNPAEAIMARRHIDSKIHRPTPHPLHRHGPSPGRLFKKATAALKRGAAGSPVVRSPAMYWVPDDNILKTPSDRRGDTTAVSDDTTFSIFGSEGTLPSARSRRNSFDGHVLCMYTPGGTQTGSNVNTARVKQLPNSAATFNNMRRVLETPVEVPEEVGNLLGRPSSPKSRNASRTASRAEFRDQERSLSRTGYREQSESKVRPVSDPEPAKSQATDLDILARKLQEIARNVAAVINRNNLPPSQPTAAAPVLQPGRDQSVSRGDGRGRSLVDDRRRTPSAEPTRRHQVRSESRNGLQDLAAAQAGVSSRSASHVRCDSCSRNDKRHESRQRGVPTSATRAWAYAHDAPAPSHTRAQSRGRQRVSRGWPGNEISSAAPAVSTTTTTSRRRSISRSNSHNVRQVEAATEIEPEQRIRKRSISRSKRSGVLEDDEHRVRKRSTSRPKRSASRSSTTRALEAAKIIDEKRLRRSMSRSQARANVEALYNMIEVVPHSNCRQHGERSSSATREDRENRHHRERSASQLRDREPSRGPPLPPPPPAAPVPPQLKKLASSGSLRGLSKSLSNLHRSMSVSHLRSPDIVIGRVSRSRGGVSMFADGSMDDKMHGSSRNRSRSVSVDGRRRGPTMAPTPPEEPTLSRLRQRSEEGRHENWVDSWMPPPLTKLGLGIHISTHGRSKTAGIPTPDDSPTRVLFN